MIINALDSIFQKVIQNFYAPIVGLFDLFTASPEIVSSFTFVNILYERIQVIAVAILILITTWQSFKVMFAHLGFECDEPWRVGARTIVFGFLINYSKDIIFVSLGIFRNFTNYIWGAYGLSNPSTEQFQTIIMSLLLPTIGLTLLSWSAIVFIYLSYKFIKLAFRFAERLMMTVFLIIISPLAFACGTAQTTKGFLQGWIKLFVGNLVVQILQITIVIAIIIYRSSDPNLISLYSFVITVAMIKVMEKLEDIVRDASMSVGIGRDLSSAVQRVQSVIHTATQTTHFIEGTKMFFNK